MARTLAQKLDFLMDLTQTKNSVLGRALNFDPSYISRIRSGKRGLPKGQPFLEPASFYFAHAIREDYQKEAAAKELHLATSWPQEEKDAAQLILPWLSGRFQTPQDELRMEDVLAALKLSFAETSAPDARYTPGKGNSIATQVFFGNAGKRDAVITFLKDLVQTGRAHTLLLFSDEDMFWLYEDKTFVRTWMLLMRQLIGQGSRIRIIHSIGRSAGDMWEAVRSWMPLYATGAVEPWFCPRLRDGIFKRTEFIAQGHSAVFGSSVPGQTDEPLNMLIRDRDTAEAMQREYEAFLKLCKPLMDIVRPDKAEKLEELQNALQNTPGELLTAESNGMKILLKRGIASLVVKEDPPYAAFIIKEPRMVAALEQYLQNP